jgi:hypothetical protein
MAKSSSPRNAREARDFSNVLRTAKGEALAYHQVFDALAQVIPLTEGLIISTLPRGTLQIAQPQRVPEPLLKSYAREFHALDRPTWQAIAKSRPIGRVSVGRRGSLNRPASTPISSRRTVSSTLWPRRCRRR